MPVEIQVRTRWQHTWADLFEKMADKFGRNIRYGEPPEHWRHLINDGEPLNEYHRQLREKLYEAAYTVRSSLVELAHAMANYIDLLEVLENVNDVTQFREEIESARAAIEEGLATIREELEGQVAVTELLDTL